MTEIAIRPARPADAPRLHELILELADYEKLFSEAAAGASPERLREHLSEHSRPRLEGFVAETPHELAGFALCYQHYSTFHTNWGLYLEDLYVRPSFRSRGIGLALMRAVAGLAVELGAVRLEWQVLDWNAPALDFYNGLGARRMTDWVTMRLTGEPLTRLARGID